jgi:hypothetical protein
MKKILLTQWYDCKDPDRHAELLKCVSHNLSLSFDIIYVFHDKSAIEFVASNVNNLHVNRRLTFRDYLQIVAQDCHRGDMLVLTNTDILLDGRIFQLESMMNANQLVALTRYEADGNLASTPWCTQDTWVLVGQQIHQSALSSSDIPLGTPGCELRFSEIMYSLGYSVFNPCIDIRNMHIHSKASVHLDEDRNYGAYLFTPTCSIVDLANTSESEAPRVVYYRQSK